MKKRIFISFAVEDSNLRDMLVGQAHNDNSPFEFVDMSVKEPWDHAWKTNCRIKIKGCDGVIAIITPNTRSADGQQWEIGCAREEGIPVVGIWGHANAYLRPFIPSIYPISIMDWTWFNIEQWLKR